MTTTAPSHAALAALSGFLLTGCGPTDEEQARVAQQWTQDPPASTPRSIPSTQLRTATPAPTAATSPASSGTSASTPTPADVPDCRLTTADGRTLVVDTDAQLPSDLAAYFDDTGATGHQSYLTVTCQGGCSLADLDTPQLIGADASVWLDPVAGYDNEDGPIFDAAPVQWGEGAELGWNEEMPTPGEAEALWGRAWTLAEKYSTGTDAPVQIYVYQGTDTVPQFTDLTLPLR